MDNYVWTCWIDAKKYEQLVWRFEHVHTNFQKMWTIWFKCGQYCPHFLEISMNIRIYPKNVNSISMNIRVYPENVYNFI